MTNNIIRIDTGKILGLRGKRLTNRLDVMNGILCNKKIFVGITPKQVCGQIKDLRKLKRLMAKSDNVWAGVYVAEFKKRFS